mgnify:CR=1 FL=1
MRAKLGHLLSDARSAAATQKCVSDFAATVCRTVFGSWGSANNESAHTTSQNVALIQTADGGLCSHNFDTKIGQQFARVRAIGILSHLRAQKAAFLKWFRKSPVKHMVHVQIADDTNVWIRGSHKQHDFH